MLNLTLTPDADTASVLARVTTNSTGVTLVRADQNGTVPVRLQEGQALESGVLTVRDYEAALVGPVTYIATTTAPVELRRNRFENPSATSTAGFGTSSGQATISREGSAVRFTLSAIGAIALGIVAPVGAFAAGDSVRMFIRARASRVLSPKARFGHSVGIELNAPNLTTEWAWLEVRANATNSSGTNNWGLVLRASSTTWAAGDWVEFDRVLYASGSDTGEWFDGSTPGAEWTGAANASASVIRGIETREVSTDLTAIRADVVSVVAQPQYVAAARVTVAQAFARPTKSIRHDVIGRPDPVFTLRRGGFRTGTVRVMVEDLGSYEMFDALQQQAAVCLFRFAAHEQGGRAAVDFYAVIEDLSSDTAEGTRALDLTLRVAEVRRPSGFLLGALGWTYGALAGLGLTYAAVPANFNTYADLAIGTEAS